MSDSRARFEAAWQSLSAVRAGDARPFDATIRSEDVTLAGPTARVEVPPESAPLPKISIASAAPSEPRVAAPTPGDVRAPDLSVVGILGEGGMGRVYLARQHSIGRDVAVKRAIADDPRAPAATALLREACTTGVLEHPNIVPVHALGADDRGRPLLVMKRVEGTLFRDLLRDPEHEGWARLARKVEDRLAANLRVLEQVCNALDFAHSRGIVHRDVKPENVMVGAYGEVYLLDWGVALDTRVRRPPPTRDELRIVGTPTYLAPEMCAGDDALVDARTDVYLLGATLHEVLTGRPRHDGKSLHAVLLAAVESAPVAYPPEVPAELAALCNAATSANPANRPASAAAFRDALADYLRHRGSTALAASAASSLARAREAEPRDPAAGALLSEGRFGFLHALHEWPENPIARAGLQEALERMIERELAQRNPTAAAALLPELLEPRPELVERTRRLERDVADIAAREERLRRAAEDADASVAARHRVWLLAIPFAVVIGTALDGARIERRTGVASPLRDVYVADAVMLVLVSIGVAAWRRKLFANRASRQVTGLSLVAFGMAVFSDVVTGLRGGDSRAVGVHGMITIATCLAVGAVTILRELWVSAAIQIVGVLIALHAPWTTSAASGITLALTFAAVVHFTRLYARRTSVDRS